MASARKELSGRPHSDRRERKERWVCGRWLSYKPRFSEPIHSDPDKAPRVRNREAEFARAETPDAADSRFLHHPIALFRDVAGALSCQAGDWADSGRFRGHARSLRRQF